MAKYIEIDRVEMVHDGNPVALKLQQRVDDGPSTYYTVSWRSKYRSGPNRRFYHVPSEGGCWTIPVQVAADLLNQASQRGMLDPRYDDPFERFGGFGPLIIDSSFINSTLSNLLLEEITGYPTEPDWGTNPSYVVAVQVEGEAWRKIMLIDSESRFCTFRSTTTDISYKPAIGSQRDTDWRLDNSMQDASTATMRSFLAVLSSL